MGKTLGSRLRSIISFRNWQTLTCTSWLQNTLRSKETCKRCYYSTCHSVANLLGTETIEALLWTLPPRLLKPGPVESTLKRFHRPWTELRVIPFCLCLPAITMPTGGFELQQLFPNKMELPGYCICLPPGKCTLVEIWKSSGGGSNFTK